MWSSIILPVAVLLNTLVLPVTAWGTLGHRTVTAVALLHFEPSHPVHTLLSHLLHTQEPTEASLFPDKIRYIPSFAYTAPWHYIDARDNPPHTCGINISRDCLSSEGGCVITAIANHTSRVADLSLPLWERSQSLRFMLHFFGDVHQPLHTENLDRGGNEIHVMFDHVKSNLHSVWDTLIPKKIVALAGAGLTENAPDNDEDDNDINNILTWDPTNETSTSYAWATFLHTRYSTSLPLHHPNSFSEICTHDATTCALQWATEVNSYVCSYVFKNEIEWLQAEDLGGEYFDGAVPIIEGLIYKGGRRLAAWLDLIVRGGLGGDDTDGLFVGQLEL